MKKLDFQMGSDEASCTKISQQVAKSMDNNNHSIIWVDLQPSVCLLRAATAISRPSKHQCMCYMPQ